MTDLEMAKEFLEKDDFSVVVVKEGKILARSAGPMVRPLLEVAEDLGDKMLGSSVADNVVGKAAALLLRHFKVRNVYAQVISRSALSSLRDETDELRYERLVPKILNRNGTDSCPLEKTVADLEDPSLAKERIEQFFTS